MSLYSNCVESFIGISACFVAVLLTSTIDVISIPSTLYSTSGEGSILSYSLNIALSNSAIASSLVPVKIILSSSSLFLETVLSFLSFVYVYSFCLFAFVTTRSFSALSNGYSLSCKWYISLILILPVMFHVLVLISLSHVLIILFILP